MSKQEEAIASSCLHVATGLIISNPTGLWYQAEAAVHAARVFMQDIQPGQSLLKLDFANAFNAINRGVILRTVHVELPKFFPSITTCYDSASHLCFGDFLIRSDEGAQQGDPLVPLVFCAAS